MNGITISEALAVVMFVGQCFNVFLTYKIRLDVLSELQPLRERLSRLEGRAGMIPAE